jgi:hypothetical protein
MPMLCTAAPSDDEMPVLVTRTTFAYRFSEVWPWPWQKLGHQRLCTPVPP